MTETKKAIIDFAVWYSGTAEEKVIRAYSRYLTEKYVPETEEDYKLAQYEARHELAPSPIERPVQRSASDEAKDKEIERLCKKAFREALQIDKPCNVDYWWAEFKLQNNL